MPENEKRNDLNAVYVDIKSIHPYEKNAKKHPPEQVEKIANSIREFGWRQPIVVDKDNIIIIGHGRLMAAKKLQMKQVPVVRVEDLTEEQIKALRLADNKTAESEWDFDLMQEEIAEIADIDMTQFGFELEEEEEEKPIIEEPVPDDEDIETRCEPGDIWKLGEHRLMCGDSTKPEDVRKLMNGELADLVVTDPPYNADYVGAKQRAADWSKTGDVHVKREIHNDVMSESEFDDFLGSFLTNVKESITDKAAFYIFYSCAITGQICNALKNSGLQGRQILVWVKNALVLGWRDYHGKYEPCIYGYNNYKEHYFIDDHSLTTVYEDTNTDFSKMKKEELVSLLNTIFSDNVPTDVIHEDKPLKNDLHPTMKPVKLIARLIHNSSRAGEKVLDLFGGSGSTLIACEQLNRKCYMMELDPHYCDVIIQRWENLTGEKAERIDHV